jgi:hypothetical protein
VSIKSFRKVSIIGMLALLVNIGFINSSIATDSFICGPPPEEGSFLYPTTLSIWWPMGPGFSEEEVELIHEMADNGVRINLRVLFWGRSETINYTSLNMYYNDTFRNVIDQTIEFCLTGVTPPSFHHNIDWCGLDSSKIWAITLGDEEPGFVRELDFSGLPEQFQRYSEEYFEETGFELKPTFEMNQTEDYVFWEWFMEKNAWAYSHMYDFIKSKWPEIQVFQFTNLEPVWYISEYVPSYQTKADGYFQDVYYARDNPMMLYEAIRVYKTLFPGKPIHMVLWGIVWDFLNTLGDGEYYQEGSLEQFRRETWVSYLAGADAVGWFNWGPSDNEGLNWSWGVHRTDEFGMQTVAYTQALGEELEKLPLLDVDPQVLLLGELYPNSYPHGLFLEFDYCGERAFAHVELDLSKYKLIIVKSPRFRETSIYKLNEFVRNGGNLLILGGTGGKSNIFGNGTRENLFPYECNSTYTHHSGNFTIEIEKPNPLDFELEYQGHFHETYASNIEGVADAQSIGNFYITDGENTWEIDESPLFLYHNTSIPDSGYILYWGADKSSIDPDASHENYDEMEPDLWKLRRAVLRAYAQFLNITNSVALESYENLIITSGIIENRDILIGIQNFAPEIRNLEINVDLSNYDVVDGQYWIHSLDSNDTLGQTTISNSHMNIETTIVKNGTRLFVLKDSSEVSGFSVNIFPPIPNVTNSLTTTRSYEPEPFEDWFILLVGSTIFCIFLVVGVVYMKKRGESMITQKPNRSE